MIVKIKVSPCRDRHAHAVSVDEYKFLPFQKTTIVGSSLSNYERQKTCLRARIGRVEKRMMQTNQSLLRHYKWYPARTSGPLPVRTCTAPVINARDATRDFVAVSQPHRGARIKELIGSLTRQELLESVVPTVVTTCSLLELIEAKTQDKSISVLMSQSRRSMPFYIISVPPMSLCQRNQALKIS